MPLPRWLAALGWILIAAKRLVFPVASIVVESSLRDCEQDLVEALGFGRRLAVVCDPATHAALGARVQGVLDAICVLLDAHPHADIATVERVREATAACDALIAVGAGTINDLCKYAAVQSGKPYAVFATAPSMNGYTSVNAAITVDGHKHTLPAAAPRGVFVDLEVLAGAPLRMIRAGIGDSICRPTRPARLEAIASSPRNALSRGALSHCSRRTSPHGSTRPKP
jgi:glycerol-1-phosphate dehydrogenase [NAD(P)+]